MTFADIDRKTLAEQLRKPAGNLAKELGETMATFNLEPVTRSVELLKVQPTDHFLEIGFGPGEGIAQVVQLTPKGYVAGIDHSPEMLEMAEQRNHRAVMEEHVELTVGTADHLPYADESFDKVFACNVFHFWPDPKRELAECYRVLKPGGTILFYLTHPTSWQPGMAESGIFFAREPEDVEKILKDAGFRNTETHWLTFSSREGKGFVVMGEK